jgi:hypothetical protein
MDGPPPSDRVPAVDHDRLFKELLTTFFFEFLDLFFPRLAAQMDRESIEFLSQELFPDLLDGAEYQADILVKARFKGQDACFLIHIEHQSDAPTTFPRRFFRYFSAIFEKHGLPVYPIVVYSHDAPIKRQPGVYKIDFPDGEVLRFRYRLVQLNRLPWRRFVDSHNPAASALMAKMKLAERDRPKVKAECLRLMVTLRLDRARMRLIAGFVDTYLRLNQAEEERFHREMAGAKWSAKEKQAVVEIVTSWEQRGIEKGLAQGIERGLAQGIERGIERGIEIGRQAGQAEALRAALIDVLGWRFGDLDESLTVRLAAIDSVERLKALTHRALTAGSIQELGV